MAETKRPLRVFLCHSKDDKAAVQRLYKQLSKDGIDAWLDTEKLIPGQDWQSEISSAVRNTDIFVVCLSSKSVTKEGFVQKEIRFALDIANEKPDNTIFIIPARLEDGAVPDRLRKFQWVDLFSNNGYDQLIKALKLRAAHIGAIVNPTNEKSTRVSENLPPKSYTQFIGRSEELDQLLNALSDQHAMSMIAVISMGGMGKTALVYETVKYCEEENLFEYIVWASAQTERFVGKSTFKTPISDFSFEQLLMEIIHQCHQNNISQLALSQRINAVKDLLGSKKTLIVLDNLETVPENEKLVDDIYQILGISKLLITSRHEVKHDRLFRILLHGFPLEEGIVFLKAESKDRGLDEVANASRDNLVEIHDATGGAPLAMKLVVGQLSRHSIATVLSELKQASSSGSDYDFYRFLFKRSWDLIPDNIYAKRLLVSMAAFPAGVGAREEIVKKVSLLQEQDFEPALDQLTLMSLVDSLGDIKHRRYAIHQLTYYFILSDIVKKWG